MGFTHTMKIPPCAGFFLHQVFCRCKVNGMPLFSQQKSQQGKKQANEQHGSDGDKDAEVVARVMNIPRQFPEPGKRMYAFVGKKCPQKKNDSQ